MYCGQMRNNLCLTGGNFVYCLRNSSVISLGSLSYFPSLVSYKYLKILCFYHYCQMLIQILKPWTFRQLFIIHLSASGLIQGGLSGRHFKIL